MQKIVKIEKYIFKAKACDSFSLAPMERAPQNYPKKCVNSKSPKIELDGFTKPGPSDLHKTDSTHCVKLKLLHTQTRQIVKD